MPTRNTVGQPSFRTGSPQPITFEMIASSEITIAATRTFPLNSWIFSRAPIAKKKYGAGWNRNPNGIKRVLGAVEAFKANRGGLLAAIEVELDVVA